MDNDRLKIKIGEFEIDAEGSTETVDKRLAEFKELVAMALAKPSVAIADKGRPLPKGAINPFADDPDDALKTIMKVEDRVVSLTVRAQNVDDAALLVLLGQKVFRENDSVTGMEVIQGLTVSGQSAGRVDRVLDKAAVANYVIVVGQHRGRRYRLSNAGLTRAREIAKALLATVA